MFILWKNLEIIYFYSYWLNKLCALEVDLGICKLLCLIITDAEFNDSDSDSETIWYHQIV